MTKIGKKIVKFRVPILIVSLLLLIPSFIGLANTRINYDMLTYLPSDMETVKGQDILLEDFGKGAFSMILLEGMSNHQVAELKSQIEQVDHVDTVVWYDSLFDITIPMEMLPQKFYDAFNHGDTTMMAVFFNTSTSADDTIQAIEDIRSITKHRSFVCGMSALVTDMKNLCEKEEPIYVAIAVILACVIMMVFMDSIILPFLFLLSIGIAIVCNLGSNVFLGEISYITKALSAVLQLGVTMDYSIFLWHSYKEQKARFDGDKERAMTHAISNTITSVVGSSITTIAGFIALCFMSFTLGKDLGIVMAKGVILGVIGCITTLPAMILIFDKAIEKTTHKNIIPNMEKVAGGIIKKPAVILILFVIIMVPALYGYQRSEVYYDLSESLPQDMDYIIANSKLQEEFDLSSTHMILVDAKMPAKDAQNMMEEIEKIDGVKYTLGFNSIVGTLVPEDMIPESVESILKSDRYQLMLVNSSYKVATNEVNQQIDEINTVIKKYDTNAMLIGEAPCTKDMITVTDRDFKVVSIISIAAIFIIIAIVLKSISLPIVLVAVIEFAIFINLGLPYYSNVSLPFVAPICISTIQLGATVDYAILMTSRYKKERLRGNEKKEAIKIALSTSIPSIIVSALGFFAATVGVGVYSGVDMIGSMCNLMARGAIISMFAVILVLPCMFMLFDKVICKTSIGLIKKRSKE